MIDFLISFLFLIIISICLASFKIIKLNIREFIICFLTFTAISNLAFTFYRLPFSGGRKYIELSLMLVIFLYIISYQGIQLSSIRLSYPFLILYILFFIVLLMYLWISPEPEYGMAKIKRYFYYGFCPAICYMLLAPYSRSELRKILIVILISSLIVSLQFMFNKTEPIGMMGRFSIDATVHPNNVSRNICIGIVICLGYIFTHKMTFLRKILFGLATIFLTTMAIQTGSRGPILASIIAVISILFMSVSMKQLIRIFGSSLLLSLVILIVSISMDLYKITGPQYDRMVDLTNRIGANKSDVQRLLRYKVAIDGIIESRSAGVGTGGFMKLWNGPPPGGIEQKREYPHNIFLEILVENGIIGFSLFMIILTIILRGFFIFCFFRQNIIEEKLLLGVWVYSLVNACVSGDIASNYIFWAISPVIFITIRQLTCNMVTGKI